MPEATEEFKRRLREAFDEMHVGQPFTFRRTFTDGDVALFCGVTGDYNPYHQDEAFARESPYGRLTIPGLLTGTMLTHIGRLLGFLATEMAFEYLAPVFVGDTITCTVTIAEKNEEKRRIVASAEFVNQDDVEVLTSLLQRLPQTSAPRTLELEYDKNPLCHALYAARFVVRGVVDPPAHPVGLHVLGGIRDQEGQELLLFSNGGIEPEIVGLGR